MISAFSPPERGPSASTETGAIRDLRCEQFGEPVRPESSEEESIQADHHTVAHEPTCAEPVIAPEPDSPRPSEEGRARLEPGTRGRLLEELSKRQQVHPPKGCEPETSSTRSSRGEPAVPPQHSTLPKENRDPRSHEHAQAVEHRLPASRPPVGRARIRRSRPHLQESWSLTMLTAGQLPEGGRRGETIKVTPLDEGRKRASSLQVCKRTSGPEPFVRSCWSGEASMIQAHQLCQTDTPLSANVIRDPHPKAEVTSNADSQSQARLPLLKDCTGSTLGDRSSIVPALASVRFPRRGALLLPEPVCGTLDRRVIVSSPHASSPVLALQVPERTPQARNESPVRGQV